jgi:hypothetical protein
LVVGGSIDAGKGQNKLCLVFALKIEKFTFMPLIPVNVIAPTTFEALYSESGDDILTTTI